VFEIEIRNVDSSYIEFLSVYDNRVPFKSNRPWLWPINIDGIDYGIPLTTSDQSAGYAGFLRCCYTATTGLNFHFMVPVPREALSPSRSLPPNLKKELDYYHEIEKYIVSEAKIIRRLSETGDMGRNFNKHSIDYAKIEQVTRYWYPGIDAGLFLSHKEDAMSIGKNGKAYFTKEELEAARANANALEYAQRQGYELVKEHNYYRMKDHDSLIFKPNGTFFWNSRQIKGDAIDFQIHYEGKSMVDAVLTLSGNVGQSYTHPVSPRNSVSSPESKAPEAPLQMPDKSATNRQLFGYLCGTRGLEKEVVLRMLEQGRLYQSSVDLKNGRQIHNAVFVYKDQSGEVCGGYKRGMASWDGATPYKKAVAGSDKNYGWMLPGQSNGNTVCVFEAAIDAASHASLEAMDGKDWQAVDRLSLEGLNKTPLDRYLAARPNVTNIRLMLDGDGPGRQAAQQLASQLREKGYQVEDLAPPFGKDWNEVLTETRSMELEQQEQLTQQQEEPEFEQ